MLNFLKRLVNRRVPGRECEGCAWQRNCIGCVRNKRKVPLKEAEERLRAAAKAFDDTITLSPERVQAVLGKVIK